MRFWIGLIIGFILASVGCGWLIYRIEQEPITFPSKQALDLKNDYHFEGSIIGDGEDAPINNFITAWCRKDRMECDVITIDDISGLGGGKQVGAPYEDTIIIRQWNDRTIVADTEGKDPNQCNWYEIKIDRKTEEIAYTRIPNKNPNREFCQGSTPKVMRWRIDNGPAWSRDANGTKRKR